VCSPDTLDAWPIPPSARNRLAAVDVTNYEGHTTTYNFRSPEGRFALRTLLLDAVARRKFVDVVFHNIIPEDVPDLRLTLEILTEFRRYQDSTGASDKITITKIETLQTSLFADDE
jgi:hypothetical protein